MSNGVLSFELRNSGNLHFTARKMVVQGIGADGHTIFSRTANGTRILTGDVREYKLPPLATDNRRTLHGDPLLGLERRRYTARECAVTVTLAVALAWLT